MLELNEEEKMFLCSEKYNYMSIKEIEERIRMHDEQCEIVLKELKRRASRKKKSRNIYIIFVTLLQNE